MIEKSAMEIVESVRAALKELIFPEIEKLQAKTGEISLRLEATNNRLDDVTTHLADQSRRIDDLRKDLGGQIKDVREELSGQIKDVREELGGRIDQTNERIDQTNVRIEAMSVNFQTRMDRLYEVIVRRDEHNKLEERVFALERAISELKRHVAT